MLKPFKFSLMKFNIFVSVHFSLNNQLFVLHVGKEQVDLFITIISFLLNLELHILDFSPLFLLQY